MNDEQPINRFSNYDIITNHMLMLITLSLGGGKIDSMSWQDFRLRNHYRTLKFKVTRVDSFPTGSGAAKSMTIQFEHSNKNHLLLGHLHSFQIKYDQLNHTIGFKISKEYDVNFENCAFVKQSSDMNNILKFMSEIFYEHNIKFQMKHKLGLDIPFEEFSYDYVDLLKMVEI